MFQILDGREHFYQWDVDRKIIVLDDDITEVHFCNRTDDCSLVCEVYSIDGIHLVDVPNILLQNDWRINVYAYDKNYTKHSECFKVVKRSKPADYVYTETEIKRYEDLEERISALEENGVPGDIDLSNYATKQDVRDAANDIVVATKVYVNNSLTGYATEEYVDNAVSNVKSNNIFKGRKASFYGDSLTEINSHYTKGYHKWVSDALGLASYNNYGVSGYRFSNVYSKVNSINDTADIIFVMCGVGEQTYGIPLGAMGDNTTDTTYGALELLCSLLKQKYPTKLVVFITPHYQTRYPHNEGLTSYEVSKAIRDVCEKYAIPVYDNFVLSGIYNTNLSAFTTDNCHWNDTGHEMVGKNLSNYMLNTFGYLYGLPSVDDGGNDDSGENGDSGTDDNGTTFEVTSMWNSQLFNMTLYVAAEDLPELNRAALNISFDIEPISEMPTLQITQSSWVYLYDVINDLNAGYVQLGTYDSIKIINYSNGIYTIGGSTLPIATPLSKPYIGFNIPFNFSVGDKFKIKNAQITHGENNVKICAIGGAFKEEVLAEVI